MRRIILILIGNVISAIMSQPRENFPHDRKVCINETCMREDARIQRRMHKHLSEACNDFYTYICGDPLLSNCSDAESVSESSRLEEIIYNEVNRILDESINFNEDNNMLQAVKYFNRICLRGTNSKVLKMLIERIGDWPLLEDVRTETNAKTSTAIESDSTVNNTTLSNATESSATESNTTWSYYFTTFKNIGLNHDDFFRISIETDKQDMSNYIVVISTDKVDNSLINWPPPKAHVQENSLESLAQKQQRMVYSTLDKIASYLGANSPQKYIYINEFIKFSHKMLCAISHNDSPIILSLDELESRIPDIPWFLRQSLNNQMFYDVPDRKNFCRKAIERCFPDIVTFEYILKNNITHRKQSAEYLLRGITKELNSTIFSDEYWFTGRSKTAAFEKIQNMVIKFGFPESLVDSNITSQYYQKIQHINYTETDEFYNYVLALNKIKNEEKLIQLFTNNKTRWGWDLRPIHVGGSYSAIMNSITIPIGIMQRGYYDENQPQYLNYAGLGYVIGHEMMHSLVGEGRDYDQYGSNTKWMAPNVEYQYNNRARCSANDYARRMLTITNQKVVNENTLDENVCDAVGFLIAYYAYLEDVLNKRDR